MSSNWIEGQLHLPQLIAHRGASHDAPENTLAALRKAHQMGATWVEFDVQLSKDHMPIVFHDATLERTTNGTGAVAEHTFAELEQLDAGSWFAESFCNEKIPSLNEWLALAAELGLGINIEIKETRKNAVAVAKVINMALQTCWRADLPTPLISSLTPECLLAMHGIAPQAKLGFVQRRWGFSRLRHLPNWRCVSLHAHYKRLTRKRIRVIKEAGYQLLAYTVNDQPTAEALLADGVDGIFSDYPNLLSLNKPS